MSVACGILDNRYYNVLRLFVMTTWLIAVKAATCTNRLTSKFQANIRTE